MDGLNHVRIQQTHGGVPVFGGDVVVHSDNMAFVGIGGNVLAGLGARSDAAAVGGVGGVGGEERLRRARRTNGDALAFDREAQQLVILPIEGGNARLTWHVMFHTEIQAGIVPTVMHYFIDAHTGEMVQRFNGIHTAATDQASGPGGIARVPKSWTNELDVVHTGSNYVMNTDRLESKNLNARHRGAAPISARRSLNFTDHGGQRRARLRGSHAQHAEGLAGLQLDRQRGLQDHLARALLEQLRQRLLGRHADDLRRRRRLELCEMAGSLDVVAHEIDHGFTVVPLEPDLLGDVGRHERVVLGHRRHDGQVLLRADVDWTNFNLGGDIFMQANTYSAGCASRPRTASSIDNASQYNSGLDVHYTSGVMNSAFCRASKRFSGRQPDGGQRRDGDRGRRAEGVEGVVRGERELLDGVVDVHAGLPGRGRCGEGARLLGGGYGGAG